ncbi:hypothetical protein Hdeb2414_s0011g00368671 [Helianthus debilis subsp. tardiflorus]
MQSRILFFFHTANFEPPPPKSYHNWKAKFFFIREEVVPIAMDFCAPRVIIKETLVVPKCSGWYMDLKVLLNQAFGESTLVAAGMSDRCPRESLVVPVFLQDGVSVLRDLPEGQKPKKSLKKKTTSTVVGPKAMKPEASVAVSNVASRKGITRPRQSRLDDYIVFADSMEELEMLGGKFKDDSIGGTRGFGSASSKEKHSSATLTFAPIDEERVPDPVPELTCKNFLPAQGTET